MNEWWSISNEDARKVREALQAAIAHINGTCASSGCTCDLGDSPCSQFYSDALHILDSGLHITTTVPSDWVASVSIWTRK